MDRTDPIERATALAPLAARLAPETEAQRRLAPELAGALRESGLLRLGVPAAVGGEEATPAAILEAAETLARADGSAGWIVSIACTASVLAGWMAPEAAREVLGSPETVAVGVFSPRARGVPADGGGLRVTGRWPFCSGIAHADWFFAGCLIEADGHPAHRAVCLPTSELEILDTWHVSGLRGTGSTDTVAQDVLVPPERVIDLIGGRPADLAPLYRFPLFALLASSVAAACLGIARAAIDDLVELAAVKTPEASNRKLAERPITQQRVAEAEGALLAARAFFYDAVATAWEATGDDLPARAGLRLAATHAARTSADVVRSMYDLGGGTAIYESSPLQRRFRDVHTATAHFQVAPQTYEVIGRVLLGLPADTSRL
jgi:alkylation response protein AidB-like acyl-CoA dehydrogenase